MTNINWQNALEEAIHHFRELLKIDTTNPPGRERPAADYIAGLLSQNGIESVVLESAPGRANLVARLKGDGSLPPLLLMGHMDVVSAEPERWSYPPFSGHIDEDGYIYGRGAVDMKQTVAAHLMATLLLKRAYHDQGRLPKRDVIFMALADEETGGDYGAQWMANNHSELFADAEYALNEGGGYGMELNGVKYILIQAGEKGTSRFYLRARGKPGHGSVPQPDASIVRLAGAVHTLGVTRLPVHLTRTTRAYLEVLAQTQPPEIGSQFQELLETGDADRILDTLAIPENLKRRIQAMLRNTAMPTILRSGQQLNVIPDFAEAGVDGRVLPGFDRDSFEPELRAVLGDDYADLTIDWTPHFGQPLEADVDGPLRDAIVDVLAERAPGCHLLPTMLTGGTDAKAIAPLGIKVFGFSPLPPDDHDIWTRVHAHDERLHQDSFRYCVQTTYDIVEKFVTAPA